MYTKVNTAFGGGTAQYTTNGGGSPIHNIGDTDVWSAIFRVQRNFWP
jgi:hypothetical protein